MEKKFQPLSKQDFQPNNKLTYKDQPISPVYPRKPNEFDKLVYVAAVFSKALPTSEFNHSNTSPFQPIIPYKK